jgi:LPPG:FO 2-phospho-L-lactate transferase
VTVLAGGVGAARFLRGLRSLLDPRRLTVIVNTADDETFFGLHVSPDVDTVVYTLANVVDPVQGWGVQNDSFRCLAALARFSDATWFRLGDLDLATHIVRTAALRSGTTLTAVTARIARAHGVRTTVLPMSDRPVRTFIDVDGHGRLPFQEYLVRRRARGRVRRIVLQGARRARPTVAALAAVQRAHYIIIPPSNPLVSIGPILALAGMRNALRRTGARIAAISPIIAGAPVKGPLHRMLKGTGREVSPVGVAKLYRDFADVFVIDTRDAALAPRIAALGMRPVITDTLMTTVAKSTALARTVLAELQR